MEMYERTLTHLRDLGAITHLSSTKGGCERHVPLNKAVM